MCPSYVVPYLSMRAERKARQPGSIESCGTDDNITLVLIAIMVDEAVGCEFANSVGEDGCVRSHERFEIAWSRRRTTTARIKVLRDDLVAQTGIIVQFTLHLLVGELACLGGFLATLDDELESLIEFVLDLLSVLEILLGIVFEVLLLLFAVFEVGAVFAGPRLGESGCDPDG